MSEADERVPEEPLDTLLDTEDTDQREETRDTSRANLAVYLAFLAPGETVMVTTGPLANLSQNSLDFMASIEPA